MNRQADGFTLIELVVALAVAAILVVIGVPTISTMLNSNERATKINDLVTSLNIARSESLRRGANVSMCRRMKGSLTDCATVSCTASTHDNCWESGWVIFVDDDADGIRDGAEEVVRVYEYDKPHHLLVAQTFTSFISYASSGTPGAAGMYKFCIDWNQDGDYTDTVDAKNWRAVSVNAMGRPKLSSDINDDGVHEDADGNPLACP